MASLLVVGSFRSENVNCSYWVILQRTAALKSLSLISIVLGIRMGCSVMKLLLVIISESR
jgi:hypothetical protein